VSEFAGSPARAGLSRALLEAVAPEAPRAVDFRPATARFRDVDLERNYRRYLTENALPRERRTWLLMSLVYFLYGALDILTIGNQLGVIIFVRWGVLTPIALGLYGLTFIKRFKPYSSLLFSFGVFLSAVSVVWMISILPPQGAPPYIIGVLVVFIFSSCNVQMPFPAACAAFLFTTAYYSMVLLTKDGFTRIDVISGHFFMISSAGVAILTNYVQEIRSRILWLTNMRRKADAERIEQLMIEATASDQSKINFLSILSHELRTPLHQIIGFSEILQTNADGAAPANSSEYLDEIQSSARRLLSSIAKMLRYADATAGKISYNLDRYTVGEIIDIATEQFASRAAQRDIVISAEHIDEGAIEIDQASTSYAVGCLIDNAINASPAHSRITIEGDRRGKNEYELRIIDRGVGMSDDQIRVAFEPFSQVSEVRTRATEGVGLGLTLARKILNDQGAVLSLSSAPGKGVTATIVFKLCEQSAAA